jgi:hypothetical protein
MSTKDVDLQLIVARLLQEVSKRKECESSETTALVNKTHKPNEKLCFYCKKPGHFVRNCLNKKNDEKEKVNQTCEDHEQMFIAALSANDHTTYDWIVDSGATQHMTFEQEISSTPPTHLERLLLSLQPCKLKAFPQKDSPFLCYTRKHFQKLKGNKFPKTLTKTSLTPQTSMLEISKS